MRWALATAAPVSVRRRTTVRTRAGLTCLGRETVTCARCCGFEVVGGLADHAYQGGAVEGLIEYV